MQRAWGGLRAYDGPTSSAMKSFCSSQSSLGFRQKQLSEPYDVSGICFECHHIYPQRWSMTSTLSKLVGSDLAADRRNVGPTACPSSWRWQTSNRAKSKYSPWTEVGGGGRRHSLRRAVPGRRLKSKVSKSSSPWPSPAQTHIILHNEAFQFIKLMVETLNVSYACL